MSSSATRAALLVAVAALLGFLILRGAADNAQFPVTTGGAAAATAIPDVEVDPENSVAVSETPTVLVLPAARNNNEVSVLVANGTAVSGQASRLTSALRNQGFITKEPRNADDQPASTIFYRPSFAPEAQVVRNILGGSTPIAPMPDPDPILGEDIDLGDVNVLVLVGADDLSTS